MRRKNFSGHSVFTKLKLMRSQSKLRVTAVETLCDTNLPIKNTWQIFKYFFANNSLQDSLIKNKSEFLGRRQTMVSSSLLQLLRHKKKL